MGLPDPVARSIAAPVEPGSAAQAFPFLTVDAGGLPHVALLSGRELRVGGDGSLLVAVAGAGTQANLRERGVATLVAVEGTTAHSVKLRVRSVADAPPLLGAVLDVVEGGHKADSLGIPLRPIAYDVHPDLARLERWDRTDAVLRALAGTTAPR